MNASFSILITDDDPRVGTSIAMLLKPNGYAIETTTSATQAMRLCREKTFDLFLIDKQMPDIDGFELMNFVFNNFPESQVIMVTGEPTIHSAVQALKMGAYDFIQKPFHADELINTVKNALTKRSLEKQISQMASRLKYAEQKYCGMIHSLPDLIFVLDQNYCFTFVNKTFTKLFGYTQEAVKGKSFFSMVPDEDPIRLKWFFNDRRSTGHGTSPKGLEIQMESAPDKSGLQERIAVEIKRSMDFLPAASTSDTSDQELCIVARDIRYRIKFEQQLIQNQKMEAVGTLAGGIAHDFNNLLMSIHGHTLWLKENLDHDNPLVEKLLSIEKHLNSGSQLTRQLLNFARGNTCEIRNENLNALVKSTASMFFSTKKRITVHFDCAEDLWQARVNSGQIEQVMLNLFVNAHHAMPNGGQVFISTKNVSLTKNRSDDSEPRSGSYIRVTIQDTGYGIDESIQEKIFDPFFTTKTKDKGTGLGLASAYGIIKHHKGSIQVESRPGQGAAFHIYLPSSVSQAKSLPDPQPRYPARKKLQEGGHILIIDDDPEVVSAIQDLLKQIGYDVITAPTGTEGVQRYMEHFDTINMVILDSAISGICSRDTCQYIKKLNPRAKILIISPTYQRNEANTLLSQGAIDILGWPFSIESLSEAISKALGKET